MRLAVATLGSAGDLHPYLAVAREMARQGHEVHFLSQEPLRSAVEAEGVAFRPIASERDHLRTLHHPGLWHPVGGFGVLWRHLCAPAIPPTLDILRELAAGPVPLTVFASPLVVGARLARDAWPLRLVSGYTAPAALRSCSEPMFLGPWKVPAWMPGWARQGLWRALDAWKLEPMVRECLQQHRRALALGPQQGNTFGEWIHSPDGGFALFPPWFAAPAADWPVQPLYAGFPLFEPQAQPLPESPALSAFLAAPGGAPVVVYPGSAASGGRDFLAVALAACRSLRRRTLLLSAYADQWPVVKESDVLAVPYAQLSDLLPQAAALIHHGGIGTCAQALCAGTPQVVLPSAYDQFDNGERVARGGWGVSHSGPRPSPATLAALLQQALALQLPRGGPAASLPRLAPSTSAAPNAAAKACCEHLMALGG